MLIFVIKLSHYTKKWSKNYYLLSLIVVWTGPQGPTGPTGLDAPPPTLTIGTVTTGAPGTDATAEITGTTPNFVLNLTIPQGPTGPAA